MTLPPQRKTLMEKFVDSFNKVNCSFFNRNFY
jgi:hypothetical protein